MNLPPAETLRELWQLAKLPEDALGFALLTGTGPVLPSSFAVATAAQASIAAAALAACELGHARGATRQQVAVDRVHAALECVGPFTLNGIAPQVWDQFSGQYRCADGWVRVHANFAHHREGALRLLGLDPKAATREDAEKSLLAWRAVDFETAAADAGLVAAALRSFEQWDVTPHGQAVAAQPLFTIERIGDAPVLSLPGLADDALPLTGVRVLDLTRILAGPVGGRALAAYGADVMLVNSPRLPNIEAISATSQGKLSTHVDLQTGEGRDTLAWLLAQSNVFVQGYRPGGLEALGFGPAAAAQQRPGIVYVSLCAYGPRGPWAARRGFDSLVQAAMGFNQAEGEAAGEGSPRPLPMQILDHATGYLIAFGAATALLRQRQEGGSWHVQVSLAQTAQWLRGLGRVEHGFAVFRPDSKPYMGKWDSGFGELVAMRHSAQLSRTPARWTRPAVPPGTNPPVWP